MTGDTSLSALCETHNPLAQTVWLPHGENYISGYGLSGQAGSGPRSVAFQEREPREKAEAKNFPWSITLTKILILSKMGILPPRL